MKETSKMTAEEYETVRELALKGDAIDRAAMVSFARGMRIGEELALQKLALQKGDNTLAE